MTSEAEELADSARLDALEAAGICTLCEKSPVAPEDIFCAVCRQWVTDTSSEVVDPVEKALNMHWAFDPLCTSDNQMCRCGWSIEGGPGYLRRHVAAEVYSALGLDGPAPWIDGPKVVHPVPRTGD